MSGGVVCGNAVRVGSKTGVNELGLKAAQVHAMHLVANAKTLDLLWTKLRHVTWRQQSPPTLDLAIGKRMGPASPGLRADDVICKRVSSDGLGIRT